MNKPNNMLSISELIDKCRQLKLTAMAERLPEVIDSPRYQDLTFQERLGVLIEHELLARKIKRTDRCLQRSGMRAVEPFNQAEFGKLIATSDRHLSKDLLRQLLQCRWIDPNHKNVIVTGASGTGKTWLLILLGKTACNLGLSVLYIRYSTLLEGLQDALDHNNLGTYRHRLNRYDLLIIDDFCSCAANEARSDALLSIIDERNGNGSLAIGSQLSVPEWHEPLGGQHNADAIIDRLFGSSYRIDLLGKSLRETVNLPEL